MASIQTGIELQDQFTGVIYGIINAVNMTVSTMENMQHTMNSDVDASAFEGVRDEINEATLALDEFIASMGNLSLTNTDPFVQPTVPSPAEPQRTPEWTHAPPGMDVFTGSGFERFHQEVQSANTMLDQLCTTQDAIAQQAYNTNVLSPGAFQDLNRLAVRIDTVRDRIHQIESNPLNMGTDTANAELEQLRSQLSQAVQEQNDLNTAMQNMDMSAVNDAYLRLSNTVSNTERYIRDNVDEQGRFNQEINEGISQADDLMNTIKGVVGAYISVQALGDVLNLSDELVQTNARLDMVAKNLEGSDELLNMVYASAQNARGSLSGMADVVARFGNNARDAFSSSEEVVAFAELVQKQMTVAGASTTEASAAMLQLSQGLGSGVLRGDELNSIFEQAPNLIQNIADYLGVPIGTIREMASEGELTADIVKNAIFAASDEINANFAAMPMTWGQIWQSMQNTATMAFQPVLQRINQIAGSDGFQTFVNGAIEALATLANVALNVFDFMASCGQFVADNWSIISPIVWGLVGALAVYGAYLAITKGLELASAAASAIHAAFMSAKIGITAALTGSTMAATAAQMGYNGALYACPIVWIIMLIIALIAIIYAVCSAIAEMTGVANSGFGVITGGVNVVIQFFKNLGLSIANIALGIGNAIAALGSNMMTAFKNAILSIQSWFYGLLSTALTVVEGICEALNKLPFVEFDYSGISQAADDYAAKSAEAANSKGEYKSIGDAFNEGMSTFDTFQDGWVSDAFDAGAAWGDGIADSVSNFSMSDLLGSTDIPNPADYDYTSQFAGMNDSLDSISTDTSGISDAMDITQEELKYMRDLAEQESVNRYTTAEITIEQTNHNTVNGGMDLDGIVSGLTDAVDEAVEIVVGKGE